jgi:dUTP pyrophosphatase
VSNVFVSIKKSKGFEDFELPAYATEGACALDLRAAISEPSLILRPGKRALVSTGVSIALPVGYEAQIRPRSGLAISKGVSLVNSPGTIDSDYRGEVGVIVINHGEENVKIDRGDRIAQMVVAPVSRVIWYGETLSETERGSGGFGSTGK